MTRPAFSMAHASLAQDNLHDVLQLIRTPNVGPVTFFQLTARYGSAAAALSALPELARRGGRKNPLVAASRSQIEKEITLTEKFGARMVMYGQADYPALLHAIDDPPPVISLLGNPEIYKRNIVGMVGARNASASGCNFARRMAQDLGNAQITVASGLARGIDGFAHSGALATGTVGVIAGGIDNIYPPENEGLYKQIREHGAIISEQPFGTLPFAGSFPGRNRIIAGMSLATVVVEAAPKSGSLITAKLALEYNREVLAVPGSPMDPRARGCNLLLKQGAMLAESAQDVLHAISHLRALKLSEMQRPYAGAPPMTDNEDELATARTLVHEKLGMTPVHVDSIIEQTGLPAPIVVTVLLEMELAGMLQRSAGGQVAI
ncbi:MAG: DNA-processing protein DprA, partial [Alphaproteobacteria bacterium]